MAESKYLDAAGLSYVWTKIKEWLGGGTIKVNNGAKLNIIANAELNITNTKIKIKSVSAHVFEASDSYVDCFHLLEKLMYQEIR